MTCTEFLNEAVAGTNHVYHVGGSLHGMDKKDLWQLRRAYNDGRIDFVQRRITKGRGKVQAGSEFEYIAIKRNRVRPPRPATSKDTMQAVHLFRPEGE